MRGGATDLGVAPMSLYHHVDGRDDLLAGMVGQLLEEVPEPAPGAPWQDRIRSLFLALRFVGQAHPRAFPLVLVHPRTRDLDRLRTAGAEAISDALTERDVPREHVAPCEVVVWTLLLGFVVREALGHFRHHRPGGADRAAAAVLAAVEHHVAWVSADPVGAHRADPGTEWATSEDVR